jgi:hypothetical protein
VKGVGLVAFRDPHGIRPLVIGRRASPGRSDEWVVASEDCAFGPIAFERVRDVKPGEMVIITPEGRLLSKQCVQGDLNPCIFEYIYLARPDSVSRFVGCVIGGGGGEWWFVGEHAPAPSFHSPRQLIITRHSCFKLDHSHHPPPNPEQQVLNDISVYNFQLGLGTRLARKIKCVDWGGCWWLNVLPLCSAGPCQAPPLYSQTPEPNHHQPPPPNTH